MIFHDAEQGSVDWLFARAGRVTASRVKEILTPKQMKLSAAAKHYALELALERINGAPLTMDFQSGWMHRGTNLEAEARDWYAMMRACDAREVGFVQRDGMEAGCSPDALVYDGAVIVGGAEIKCRSALQHAKSVLDWREIAEPTQVQFSLWVTGLPWWDVVAYCPGLPGRIQRVEPDAEWQEAFDAHIPVFLDGVDRVRQQLEAFHPVRFDDDLEGQLQATVDAMYGSAA